MIKDLMKLLIVFGVFCVLIGILFRFYAGLYVVPFVQVTPDAVLRFSNTVFWLL